jgi:hypothetical protein
MSVLPKADIVDVNSVERGGNANGTASFFIYSASPGLQ